MRTTAAVRTCDCLGRRSSVRVAVLASMTLDARRLTQLRLVLAAWARRARLRRGQDDARVESRHVPATRDACSLAHEAWYWPVPQAWHAV